MACGLAVETGSLFAPGYSVAPARATSLCYLFPLDLQQRHSSVLPCGVCLKNLAAFIFKQEDTRVGDCRCLRGVVWRGWRLSCLGKSARLSAGERSGRGLWDHPQIRVEVEPSPAPAAVAGIKGVLALAPAALTE
jgi:hypothetical protein